MNGFEGESGWKAVASETGLRLVFLNLKYGTERSQLGLLAARGRRVARMGRIRAPVRFMHNIRALGKLLL